MVLITFGFVVVEVVVVVEVELGVVVVAVFCASIEVLLDVDLAGVVGPGEFGGITVEVDSAAESLEPATKN